MRKPRYSGHRRELFSLDTLSFRYVCVPSMARCTALFLASPSLATPRNRGSFRRGILLKQNLYSDGRCGGCGFRAHARTAPVSWRSCPWLRGETESISCRKRYPVQYLPYVTISNAGKKHNPKLGARAVHPLAKIPVCRNRGQRAHLLFSFFFIYLIRQTIRIA